MPGVIATLPKFQFSSNGIPMVGGSLTVYVAGTTTPTNTWQDSALTVANTNPITLDSRGECVLWLDPTINYKFVLKNAQGVIQWTQDSISGASPGDSLGRLAASSGAGLVGWIRSVTGAVATTLGKWLARQNASLHDFMSDAQIADSLMATPALDCTAAVQAWLATAGARKSIYLPAGRFRFNALLTAPLISGFKIYGEGRQASQLVYFGAGTTGDLFTVGDGTTFLTGIKLRDFNIDSLTTMTAGHGMHIKKAVSGGVTIQDVSFGQLNSTKKLWNGIRFTNCNVCQYIGWEINCLAESIVVVGDAAADSGSDLILDKGTSVGGTVGLHQGGGFGGLYVGDCLFYGQTDTSYLQDNAIVARANRETILSDRCVLDAANAQLIKVNETAGTNSILQIGAFLSGAGFFTASPGDGVYIQAMPVGRVSLKSAQLKGNKRHGLRVEDASCNVTIDPTTYITDNAGWGIFSGLALSLVSSQARLLYNTLGDIHANVRDWVLYVPALGSGGGPAPVGTNALRYRRQGSTVQFTLDILITNNNGATGSLIAFLPFNVREGAALSVVERATSGLTMQAFVDAGTSAVVILTGGNAYPAVNGSRFKVSGTVEV